MSAILSTVRRAANRRQDAETAYRAAVRAAREAGHTLEEIGKAAGISKHGAHYLLNPDTRKGEGDA